MLVALLLPALVACGTDDETASDQASESSGSTGEGLAEVSFSGEVGEGIEAEFSAEVPVPDETSVTTLVEGDGEEIAEGDTVRTYLWVANGTAQEEAYDDYANGAPQSILNDAQVGFFGQLLTGQTYGSRVVAVTTPDELFGQAAANNALGIGVDDSVVIVADLVEKVEASPEPSSDEPQDAAPEAQPTVVEEGGSPVGLDFSGMEEPELDAPVQVLVLEEGDGRPVKAADTVSVDYLGSTFDADAPFDESYSRGTPLESPLSGLIPGWTIGLTGVPVGSRVLLQIPPAFGYGAEGSPPTIPGNATLWFLIDVLEAK